MDVNKEDWFILGSVLRGLSRSVWLPQVIAFAGVSGGPIPSLTYTFHLSLPLGESGWALAYSLTPLLLV